MTDYDNYARCGEIFKSQILSEDKAFLLRCLQCEDVFLLFEAFVSHCDKGCYVSNEATANEEEEYPPDFREDTQTNTDQIVVANQDFSDQLQENNPEDNLTSVSHVHESEVPEVEYEVELNHVSDDDAEHGEVLDEDIIEYDYCSNEKDSECEDDALAYANDKFEDEQVMQPSNEKYSESEDDALAYAAYSDDKFASDVEDKQTKNEISKETSPFSTSIVSEFMNNKQHVLALIEAYKGQTPLWHKTCSALRHKEERMECFGNLTKSLNQQCNLDLHWTQVSTLVVHIVRKYREDLKNIRECEGTKKSWRPLWFFEDMQFLQPIVENNFLAKLDPLLPNLSHEQIVSICSIYENLPHLWNTQLMEHRSRNKRSEAEKEMIIQIKANLGYELDDRKLVNYLKNLHFYFSHEKRQLCYQGRVRNDSYFSNLSFLSDHVGPFQCSQCNFETQSSFKLRIHQSQHDGSMPFKCPLCSKEFTTIPSYDVHVRRHMEDYQDICKECGRKFITLTDLKIHMRTHTAAMPFCCEICGISFRHSQTLMNHKRRHTKNYLHTCPVCSKGFYSKAKINDHMKTHTNVRDCVCKTCGKAFKTMNALRTHEMVHSDVRKYVCKLCTKSFKLCNGLSQHMRTHDRKRGESKSSESVSDVD